MFFTISKPLAAFPHIHVKAMVCRERTMDPVTMTVINPSKENWSSQESNMWPQVLHAIDEVT